MRRSRLRALLLALSLGVTLAGAAGADSRTGPEVTPDSPSFPMAGMDLITHEVTVDLHQVNPDSSLGNRLETLKFKGRMVIERGDPFMNDEIGRRQVDFVIKSWEADAWSEKLNTLVIYRLASSVPQKNSTITAQQKEADYPARIHFHVTFDVLAYDGTVTITPYEGEPQGPSFMEIPPSGNRRTSPTITQFDTGKLEIDHPTFGRLRFVPIACDDEGGETLVTFTEEQKSLLKIKKGTSGSRAGMVR